jgi:hypothetical protein
MADYFADYLALKESNDRLREEGRAWIWESVSRHSAEINSEMAALPPGPADPSTHLAAGLQIGRQDWQFKVGRSVMVGERIGVRYAGRTLVIEVGWPREPEHGHVPDHGLARGRVSMSANVMLEAMLKDELILKRNSDGVPVWHYIRNSKTGEVVSETGLRHYLEELLK